MIKKISIYQIKQEADKLRKFLLKAELDRLNGAKTYTNDEAKELLLSQIDNI
ncbi:hypothetical protein QYB48_002976 [Clostridium perfringens]|nr:hypothetical protein [Clostridium perfringens]MDK0637101.1 hypothetical protein [Clostridium perfringens]